jgi:hypothetical protein
MVIVGGRRSLHGEGKKSVLAFQQRRALVELRPIQWLTDGEFARPTERRPRFVVGADVITIAPRDGAVACMKLGTHLVCGGDPDIFGQHRVQCTAHSGSTPTIGKANTDRLTSRMHAGVSSS